MIRSGTPRRIDLTGQQFGRLTVLHEDGRTVHSVVLWACRCNCGQSITVSSNSLRTGTTKSCGCYKKSSLTARMSTHRKSKAKVYRAWINMRHRCQNPRAQQWSNYGGRGITVCREWESFERFYADMGDPPAGMTLDRVDVNGNYEPSNCRWTTPRVQTNNRRTTVRVEFEGVSKTLPEWAEQIGISSIAMHQRYKRGDLPPYLFRPAGMRA